MSEPSTPPAPPSKAGWLFAWIFSTVIGGLALRAVDRLPDSEWRVPFCWAAGAVILILQIVSAIKLGSEGSGCLSLVLLLGGWALTMVCIWATVRC